MKKILFSFLAILNICLLVLPAGAQTVYQIPTHDIHGNVINLQSFSGKKVMFLIIPVKATDTSFLQIDTFLNKRGSEIEVVGVVSFEGGYTQAMKEQVVALYKGKRILLTEGMKITKGADQSALMQWLTDKSKNGHFSPDCRKTGYKFFINTEGKLFAVFPPVVDLNDPVINRAIQSGMGKK